MSSNVVSNFWGKLEHVNFNFLLKKGNSVNLTHEVYGKSDGIAVLLYNSTSKNIVLVKQFRMPVYKAKVNQGYSIEVVGGTIDNNESIEESAIREIKEEVGYKIDNLKKITTVFLSPGIVREKTHLFIAEYKEENKIFDGGGVLEENEEIEILEIPFVKCLQMVKNEEIIDARTLILLQYIEMNNLIKL